MGIFSNEVDYFGLDIGSSGIRVMHLKKTTGKPALQQYGQIAVPANLTSSDAPADIAKVAELMRQLLKDTKITSKYVVAGVPSNKVFASVITTPKLEAGELAKAIKLQADQYIPMAISDVKLDWFVLGPAAKPEQQEVLLVAAPTTITEKYLSIAEQAGLELVALEPNAIALARAVVQPGDLAVLVLDIGTLSSDITIVHANMPKLLRSVNVGGDTFVKSVAQNLGLDDVQATQFTQKFGLTQSKLEGQVLKAIKPSIDQLVDEIDKSVTFFKGQNPDVKLEKIMLTGGTVAMPELPAYLSTATGFTIEVANSWVNVGYDASKQNELMAASMNYGVTAGLAERDLLS